MSFTRLARPSILVAAVVSLVVAATVRVPADAPSESVVHSPSHPESQTHLLNDIKYLASDELEGRGIGTKGLNKAADYIREQFKEAGLDVTQVNGGAFQFFKMTTKAILGHCARPCVPDPATPAARRPGRPARPPIARREWRRVWAAPPG